MRDPLEEKLSGARAPIYLLHGDEDSLSRQYAQWLRERALMGAIEDFNLDRWSAHDGGFDVARVVAAARTPPMMADRRVVWVQGVEALNLLPRERVEDLLGYVSRPEPETLLILEGGKPLDKNRSLWKALSQRGAPVVIIESEALKGEELARWARGAAAGLGMKLEDEALALLQESSQDDLDTLRDALQKLKLYLGAREVVVAEDVRSLLPEAGLQAQIWDIADLVMTRDQGRALEVAQGLLSAAPSESERAGLCIAIHVLLVKRVQSTLVARAFKELDRSDKDLATFVGMHPYGAKKLMQSIGRVPFSQVELAQAMRLLLHADLELKGSQIPNELILERLLLDLCLLGRGA
jgi:DNA polymerase-3 subunit delta